MPVASHKDSNGITRFLTGVGVAADQMNNASPASQMAAYATGTHTKPGEYMPDCALRQVASPSVGPNAKDNIQPPS